MNQQQSSSTTKKDIILQLLQSGVLKQRNLNDKISHEEISRLIDDIVSSNENNTGELRRSKRDMGRGIYYSVVLMYRAYRLVDKLGWKRGLQVVNRYLVTKRGQEKTLETARELLGDIEDIEDFLDFLDGLKQILSPEPGEEQVTGEYSDTSLHLAAEQGNLNAVEYFVEKGGDISAKTNGDDTPLYKAAFVVEMQLARDKGFEKRAQAYAGKVYSRQSGRYTNLKKVFFIAISNCILFPKKSNYISSHTIRDEETNEHDLQCLSLKH